MINVHDPHGDSEFHINFHRSSQDNTGSNVEPEVDYDYIDLEYDYWLVNYWYMHLLNVWNEIFLKSLWFFFSKVNMFSYLKCISWPAFYNKARTEIVVLDSFNTFFDCYFYKVLKWFIISSIRLLIFAVLLSENILHVTFCIL